MSSYQFCHDLLSYIKLDISLYTQKSQNLHPLFEYFIIV